jgi:hypothetical protein
MTSVTVDAENPKYADLGCNGIFEKATNKLVVGCNITTIPDGITTIGYESFWAVTAPFDLVLPESVTTIEGRAFHLTDGLRSINIPSGITFIDEENFICSNLTDVYCYASSDINWEGGMKWAFAYPKSTIFHVADAAEWETKFPEANAFFVSDLVDFTLAEDAENTGAIGSRNGHEVNATLTRTLKAGSWNTFAAPFDIDAATMTAKGITAKELTASSLTSGTLTLTFADASAIEAGKPYIVKWPATGNDIVNPVFAGVTIKNQATATDNYFFEGSYNTLASTDGQILDAHNVDGKAFHAALSLSSLNDGCYDFNCYTDAEHTTPVGGTIPFNASDGSVTLYPKWALALNNNDAQAAEGEKNADIISEAANTPTVCDVTLAGRTLYKDGEWNTLCLPFNLGNLQAGEGHYFDGTLLEGATVMTLRSTEFENGTLTMNFINMPMVIAGVPYIVKWEGDGSNNLVAPVFEDVTISNSTINLETDYVDFIGTYSTTVIYEDGDEKHNLYLGSGNNLYYPSREGYSVKACRAYFQLKNGLTARNPTAGVREFKLNFDGEITTGIIEVNTNNTNKTSDAFDLQGRKVENPKKGLYIVNGKKVVKH